MVFARPHVSHLQTNRCRSVRVERKDPAIPPAIISEHPTNPSAPESARRNIDGATLGSVVTGQIQHSLLSHYSSIKSRWDGPRPRRRYLHGQHGWQTPQLPRLTSLPRGRGHQHTRGQHGRCKGAGEVLKNTPSTIRHLDNCPRALLKSWKNHSHGHQLSTRAVTFPDLGAAWRTLNAEDKRW